MEAKKQEPMVKKIVGSLFIVLIISLLAASAQNYCADTLAPKKSLPAYKNAASVGPNRPKVERHENTVTLDWSDLIKEVQKNIERETGLRPTLKVSVVVDGIETHRDLIETQITLIEKSGQHDYFLLFKDGDKVLHRSDLELKETKDAQNIKASSFSGVIKDGLFTVGLNSHLKSLGLSEKLTRVASELGYKKIVWVLKPNADSQVKEVISSHDGVDVQLNLDSNRNPLSASISEPQTGKVLLDNINVDKNFFIKVDASFNGNAFKWDDALVALATVPYHPELAASTVEFWLTVQKANKGMIPREVRKSNLLSLWFKDVIRNGKNLGPNLQYSNPYLLHWVAEYLYAYNPNEKYKKILFEVAKSMEDYAKVIESTRSVVIGGKWWGFATNALGSGADDSRGERGNFHEPKDYQSAWVDMLAQHIAMFKSMSRIYKLANQHGLANARWQRALELEEHLNRHHWNEELGFYFDLVPDGKGGLVQDTRFESISGFWPLFSESLSKAQLEKFIERQMTIDGFGGEFPFPANSRRSISASAKKDIDDDGYWNKWSRWPSMAAIAIEGFRRSGREQLAYELAVKYLSSMAKASESTVYEFYGEGRNGPRPGQHLNHHTRSDFAGWGKVPPIYNMLTHVLGFEPQLDGTVSWALHSPLKIGESLSINNIILNGKSIRNLTLKKISEKSFELSQDGSAEFRLSLNGGRAVKIRPGMNIID